MQSEGLPPTGHKVFAETSSIQEQPVQILLCDENLDGRLLTQSVMPK